MNCDFLIVGAGISGAAAAYELARHGSVILVEAEAAPGYHSTGRSAALYTRNYGNAAVRRLSRGSHGFFLDPPDGFADGPLLTPRGSLTIARPEDRDGLADLLALSAPGHEIEDVDAARCLALAPLLRPEWVGRGAYEPGVMDMDVASIHQGFLRGAKARGAQLLCNRRVTGMQRANDRWRVSATETTISARIVVNAAGAWADRIAAMAGAAQIGLAPKRRTAIIVDVPDQDAVSGMPAVEAAGSDVYFKPDAGRLMVSPGDQTPTEPQDAQPHEYDVAVAIDWLERHTTVKVQRIASSWAGLRSFVADESPVVGFDARAEGFFWLAAQGGYGIMMAPILARMTAGLITAGTLPQDVLEIGLAAANFDPSRI